MVDSLPPNAMHDILESVLQYEVKEMLKLFIKKERYFTLDTLNECISAYGFRYHNDKNKQSLTTEAEFASNDNSLKQIILHNIINNTYKQNITMSINKTEHGSCLHCNYIYILPIR